MLKLLAVISPAKTLDFESEAPVETTTKYRFAEQAQTLIDLLRHKTPQDIQKLMSISEKLAVLNVQRYHDWHPKMTVSNSKQALFAFKGDVYTGLSAGTLTLSQIEQSQTCLRILSGLYGLLRPLDSIQPYRLEMGTRLENPKGKSLYDFWGDQITDEINADIKEGHISVLVNLASIEYFSSVNADKLTTLVITPIFKDEKNGRYKVISFFAKKARGAMVRYILENEFQVIDDLKGFDYGGYQFSEEESDDSNWVFKRKEQIQ